MDIKTLHERAVKRGLVTWVPLDPINMAVNELADQEEAINILGRDSILQGLVAADEAAYLLADLRDRLFDLDMLGLEQDQQLAAERFHAERQALALKIAGETLLLAAKEYGVQVDAIIMAAREYAAVIDREGIELQKQRALMDVKKEGAHLQEVEARLLLELVERRNQEIELAKAKVEVARANIRALMADIQAEEAELRVVRAELEVAQAEADKAGLIADVAQILADIVVRGLAKIKLAVDTAELEAAFGFIEQRLTDMINIATAKMGTEEIKLAYEKLLNAEVAYLQQARITHVDIEKLKTAMAERLLAYEQSQQSWADLSVKGVKDNEQARKQALAQAKHNATMALNAAQTNAAIMGHSAQQAVSSFHRLTTQKFRTYRHIIRRG